MQNNISNFIPNWRGKRGSILKRDTELLVRSLKNDSMEIIENTTRRAPWRILREESYISQRNAEEWATTIYADSTLAQGDGNPPYYPPVPAYDIPKGRSYTGDEIEKILALQNNTFVEEHVDVSSIGLTTKEINQRLESIYTLHPGLLENSIIYEVDDDVITGFVQEPDYSCPETTSYAGYMVGVTVTEDGKDTQINHVYVYKNAMLIAKLIEFLAGLKVSNTHDLESAQKYLKTISI